ncbi:hypothetical protein [Bacteroides helcogenes]|uniref:hypothetical protein n=1 Tax=Bacteroides helcogenes TaxID=290053 RepID=UPI0002E46772|nr:hypothetical protein [Bacteroides helcogenes]MDY5239423.1 hypothetical protein [Bacteroides helcogenes]
MAYSGQNFSFLDSSHAKMTDKLSLRHLYYFSCLRLVTTHTKTNSFHHGVLFFPPRCTLLSTTVESKVHRGGKNKY